MTTVSPPPHGSEAADAGGQTTLFQTVPEPIVSNEFDYRPVPLLAPVSFCLGLLSALGFLGVLLIPIGFVGILVGLICVIKLKRGSGEYGGMWLAASGLVLSTACSLTSSAIWANSYRTELPDGFKRVNFTSDISKKGFVVDGRSQTFHPDVEALDGKPIFIKGYMYPTRQVEGLRSFLLVKDTGQCCFGGNPAITDMIMVSMEEGKRVDHRGGLVSVAGVFHCKPGSGPAGLTPVYSIDGTSVEDSRTIF